MQHSGIGGGGFMLVRSSDGTYESIGSAPNIDVKKDLTYKLLDFRETAPAAAFENMYKDHTMSSIVGGLASGVPGLLRGLEYLHTKYGVRRISYKLE
jgi:gamma-glutamyltranspeptidase/glutathione hydrolase